MARDSGNEDTMNQPAMSKSSRCQTGFTLIELMITVVIVGILAAVAYPNYAEHVAKGRRADARARIMAAQQWMERFYTQSYSYATDADGTKNDNFANQAFSTSPPAGEGATMYTLAVAVTHTTYTITAFPQDGSPMENDACGRLTIDNAGVKSVVNHNTERFDSLDAAVAACWR